MSDENKEFLSEYRKEYGRYGTKPAYAETPARAHLIAILKALIAKDQTND